MSDAASPAVSQALDDDRADEVLGTLAGEGDRKAFETLVHRWQDRVFRFALGRLGHRGDAQDALQEAFASAWRYRASYRPRWRYSTWLYRIAIRECGRIARRRPPPGVPQNAEPGNEFTDDPVTDAHGVPVWSIARSLLAPLAFTALWLHYHEDWTVKEISACLQRPAAWVRLSLHRSRRRLASRMEQYRQ